VRDIRSRLHPRLLLALATVCLATMAACGGGGDGGGGTTNPPPPATLDNIVVSPTTVSVSAGSTQAITASGRSAAGATVSGVSFTFSTSNAAIATVSQAGLVLGISAGTATITVTGTSGSVSKTATVNVSVTGSLPTQVTVVAGAASNDFTPQNVALARGGTVTWTFGALTHNVDFQGAAGAPANIPNTSNASVSRIFGAAGTFAYICTLHSGQNGSVFVP
jgi:plastocyanin